MFLISWHLNSKFEYTVCAFDLRARVLFHRSVHYLVGPLVDQITDIRMRWPVVIRVHTECEQLNVDIIPYVESYDGFCERIQGTDH